METVDTFSLPFPSFRTGSRVWFKDVLFGGVVEGEKEVLYL